MNIFSKKINREIMYKICLNPSVITMKNPTAEE